MTLNFNQSHLRPGANTDAGLVRLVDFMTSTFNVQMASKIVYTDPRGVKRVFKDRYGQSNVIIAEH